MKQLSILSVPDMLLLNCMIFYHKYKHKEIPDYFASFTLHTQGSSHNYNIRQRGDIRTNGTRINLAEKYLRNYLPKTINSTPNYIWPVSTPYRVVMFVSVNHVQLYVSIFIIYK